MVNKDYRYFLSAVIACVDWRLHISLLTVRLSSQWPADHISGLLSPDVLKQEPLLAQET